MACLLVRTLMSCRRRRGRRPAAFLTPSNKDMTSTDTQKNTVYWVLKQVMPGGGKL